MTTIQQLVLKFIEGLDPKISLKDALLVIHSQIEVAKKITDTFEQNFKDWGKGEAIVCPHCGSPTLLEFVECHWCGHQVLETVNNPEQAVSTKTEKVEKKAETPKNCEAQMGNEPPATLNFEGKAPIEVKEEKKTRGARKPKEQEAVKEAPVKEADKSTIEAKEAIKLLRAAAKEAENKETGGEALKEINKSSGLNIDAKKECEGKLSVFRAEIVKRLNAKANELEKALADAEKAKVTKEKVSKKEKPVTEKPKTSKKDKSKPVEVEVDEDFPEEMEDVPSKFKAGKKEVDITDEDLTEEDDDLFAGDDELADEVDATEEIDLDGAEAVDLSSIDVDDLSEEDFDLDD